jgi:hypothetical protein
MTSTTIFRKEGYLYTDLNTTAALTQRTVANLVSPSRQLEKVKHRSKVES